MGQALAMRQTPGIRTAMDAALGALREQRRPSAQAPAAKAAEGAITDKQLRALHRRHLYMMLRDQESELHRLREEMERLLIVYKAGQGVE